MRNPQAPCHACGRRASEHPSMQAMGGGRTLESAFGDDDLGGELELERGGTVASHAGPSTYAGGGLSLGDDDPFADDVPEGSLELDLPAHEASKRTAPAAAAGAPPAALPIPDLPIPPPGPRSNASMPASAPSMPASAPSMPASAPSMPASAPSMPASAPSMPAAAPTSHPVPMPTPRQPPDPAALIARYPPPPEKVWEAPIYAMKVLWRQLELRQDLASLRKRRSPDVPLYERALKTHDPKTFALGLILTCAGLAIASFVFFLPVILRFLLDPD